MINEDLTIYEEELEKIDAELRAQDAAYPVEFCKRMHPIWNKGVKHYYAMQLHVNVSDMVARLECQQHKCCTCAKWFDYGNQAGQPVLGRLRVREPFVYANLRFRCQKCCEQNVETLAQKFDCIPELCCAPATSGEK